jgi:Protein of unknown function (DUF2726)
MRPASRKAKPVDMTPLLPVAAIAGAFVAVLFGLYSKNRQLRRQLASRQAPPLHKSAEEQQNLLLSQQLEAVTRKTVKFTASRVMGRGEFELFRAALDVTRQPLPPSFYVFPQVALGQIIRTTAPLDWQADHAHRAINSKRCDLLIADRHGNPVAVLEYQGSGHNIGGTVERRDRIKRIALERAGVQFVEIMDGATPAQIQRTIRSLLTGTPSA